MPFVIFLTTFVASVCYVASTYSRASRARARREAQWASSLQRELARPPRQHKCPLHDRGTCQHCDEPQDAIPAGYPGYKGSVRYVPYTNDESEH
jgi:hypothetical protein